MTDLVLGSELLADRNPRDRLRELRGSLAAGHSLVLSAPNTQHWSRINALLRADVGYAPNPAASYADLAKLLLDAGFLPSPSFADFEPAPAGWLEAAVPLLAAVGVDAARTAGVTSARTLVVRAIPLPDPPPGPVEPATVACCVSDRTVLAANLLASPDLGPGTSHQILTYEDCPSAADGLNRALAEARHDLVVGCHQDVYLPAGWFDRFRAAWAAAEARFGPLGVAGVYGVTGPESGSVRAGRVVDRERLLAEPARLPASAQSLDELLLAVRRDSGLRFEAALGWHLYGTDVCLRARGKGLAAAVLDAPCFHHSRGGGQLPPAFRDSGRMLARTWASSLPVATPCAVVDRSWTG